MTRWHGHWPPVATSPRTIQDEPADSTSPSSTSPLPSPTGHRISHTSPTRRRCSPHRSVGSDGHPRVDDIPGHHGRPGGGRPRRRIGPGGRERLPSRLQPGENRSGQRHLELRQYAESGLGDRQGVTGGRTGVLRSPRRPHGARVRYPGGRAHQAVGEHLSPRQHRAGQRIDHVRRGDGHRRLGGHRRGVDEALRLPPIHAGPRGGRTLPADRSQLPVVEGAQERRPAVPDSSSSPTTSMRACPTTSCPG